MRDSVRVHKALVDSLGVKKLFPPALSERAAARYRAQGGIADVAVIDGDGCHLDGVLAIAKQGEAIRAFLAR